MKKISTYGNQTVATIEKKADDIVRTRRIYKNYRQNGLQQTPALNNVDLSVQRGEFCMVMGPSGCGKSTLLHLLGLMLRPDRADLLTLDGVNVLGLKQSQLTKLRRDKIGFVFQRFNLLDTLTAEENLQLALQIKNKSNDDQVHQMLDRVGLGRKAKNKPQQMSIGEQQRLAIARAVIHQPALLLADEPTGNLDSDNTEIIMDLIESYNREFNQTIIMVTHNPDLAERADRVITMKDGRIENE